MPRPKPKLQRMCLGCNQRDAQPAMVRIAILNDAPAIDEKRLIAGRGGYLHRDDVCLLKFVRSKVKEFRSLRRKLTPDDRRQIIGAIHNAAGELETAGIR
jgi:predicted RNA-binding protein YlxR (DUF448 family)